MTHFKRIFYVTLGYCWEISNYSLTTILTIENIYRKGKINQFKIFLTDKLVDSMPTLDLSTHRGHDILLGNRMDQAYLIELTRFSSYNPKDDDYCINYYESEFQSCVDGYVINQLTDGFTDYLKCNPPYLTNTDACTDMDWRNTTGLSKAGKRKKNMKFKKMLQKLIKMERYTDENICKPPCTVTRSNVRKGRSEASKYGFKVNLKFDNTIIYSKAEFGYNFSNFLVDLGSAVGLWFGISVFGKLLFY